MHARDWSVPALRREASQNGGSVEFFLFLFLTFSTSTSTPPPKKQISTQTEELLIKRRALLEKKIEAEQGKAREQAALKNKRGKSYL
jgi:hypothetical protein